MLGIDLMFRLCPSLLSTGHGLLFVKTPALIIEPAIDLGRKDVGIEAFYTEKVCTHPPFLKIAV
jgi:hypothetical protein